MAVVISGTDGITTPGLTNTGTETIVNLTTTGNTILGDASTDTLNVGNGGLVKDASGNVGIGTASPGAKLDVRGGISTGYSSGQGVYYYNSDGTNSYEIYNAGATGSGNPILSFYQIGTGERMRIDSSGNVGIGTASPSSYTSGDQLVVASTSGNGQMTLAGADNANPTLQFRRVSTPSTVRGFIQYDNTSEWMRFATNGSERARIDSSGNLLVGTTSGSARLTVQSSASGATCLSAANSSTTGYGAYIQGGSSGYYALYVADYAGTARLIVDAGGGITIQNLSGTGSRTVTASAAGVLSAASDSSLKQEVTDAHIAGLAEIMQVQPKAYKWLDDIAERGDDAAVELGFFADQVAPLIPSAAPKSTDGLYGFYDRSMLATMVKAIQEQQAIITSLQADVASLQAPQGTP